MDVSDNLTVNIHREFEGNLVTKDCLGNATDLRRNSLLVFLRKSSDWDPSCAFRSQASQASQASSSVPRGDEKVWKRQPSDKMPFFKHPSRKATGVFQIISCWHFLTFAEKKISNHLTCNAKLMGRFTIVNHPLFSHPWKLIECPLKTNDPMVGSQRR